MSCGCEFSFLRISKWNVIANDFQFVLIQVFLNEKIQFSEMKQLNGSNPNAITIEIKGDFQI